MKYAVTFCSFDHTLEGNPFWHGAFFLSQLNEESRQFEVVETWGYYAAPSTGDPNSWFVKAKKSVGMDVDVKGNHGWLTHEEVRYMDLGYGLHGDTFELTAEQFKRLQNECMKRMKDQNDAVNDVVASFISKNTSGKKVRHYAGEQYSRQIFDIEKRRAKEEGRESRLKEFDFNLSMGLSGPSLKSSHTCKSEALNILETVLPSEEMAAYRASTFPRFVSGGMERIILHSRGPLTTHKKADGKEVYYRDGKDPEVKLVWTVPPQKFKPIPGSDTGTVLALDEEYRDEAKAVVSKLQQLEWLLRNAEVPQKYKSYQNDLIQRIIDHYHTFSIIEPKTNTPKVSGWMGSMYSLFSLPRSPEQASLQKKIKAAKELFNWLYMALVDDWDIYEGNGCHSESTPDDEIPVSTSNNLYFNPLEALVTYLSEDVQKKLCAIIGRTYSESYSESEEERAYLI